MYTLVTTLSGESSNSYVDVAYADTYFANHYSSVKATAWASLSSTQRAMALYHACRTIESLRFTVPFIDRGPSPVDYAPSSGSVITMNDDVEPTKATRLQALQFPRNVDRNSAGTAFIPEAVKNAQCEQALAVTTFDEDAAASRMGGLDYESITAGQVSITQRFTGSAGSSSSSSRVSPIVSELVKPFLFYSGKLRRA